MSPVKYSEGEGDTEKLLGSPSLPRTASVDRRGRDSDKDRRVRRWLGRLWSILSYLLSWAKRHIKLVLLLTSLFALSLTLLILHLRPPPQAPYGWRDQCRSHFPNHWILSNDPVPADRRIGVLGNDNPAWPYASPNVPTPGDAEGMERVNVFIGVFTVAKAKDRRMLIRETYTRQRAEGVRWVFVLGKAEGKVGELQAEAELYGDIVFLPIKENMNRGKTYHFFKWAADNAIMDASGQRPDYVMKADDDSFIMLGELERRLRVIPRSLAYWGLLMWGSYRQTEFQGEYMSGGGYALSFDLVQHIAHDTYAAGHIKGDEDQITGDWIRAHPQAERIVWVVERCWIYDHPRQTGWAMAHGFLFPNVVSHIRSSTETTLSHLPPLPTDLLNSWSTVTDWLVPYFSPPSFAPLTVEERIEAMVEGSAMSLLHPHNRRYANISADTMGDDGAVSKSDVQEVQVDNGFVARILGMAEREKVTREQVKEAWNKRKTMEEKMRGYEQTGSTVFVHEVKQEGWWIETALALMGTDAWAGSGMGIES